MASSLNRQKTIEEMIDEDLAKYRAMVERDQERIHELEERNTHFADSIRSGLVTPLAGFAAGYARGYYGEKASIFGISIDACAGVLLGGFAALLGISSNKAVQTVAKLCGDIAHGALACWAAGMGAELGLKKRMETPALPPAPKPLTGAEGMPQRAPRSASHEDLAALKAALATPQRPPSPVTHEELAAFPAFTARTALNTQPATQERPPMPMQSAAPTQSPASPAPKMNPLPKAEAPQHSQSNTQQSPSVKAESAPDASSTRKTPYRFTHREPVEGEGGLTTLLRSFGIPPISETPNWPNWPSTQTSIENFDRTLRWARAPA